MFDASGSRVVHSRAPGSRASAARAFGVRDVFAVRARPRGGSEGQAGSGEQVPAQRAETGDGLEAAQPAAGVLPPSVARVAGRTRLSAELLAAILTVEGRSRATLDDMERADALADALLARRRERAGRRGPTLAQAV